MEQIRPRSVDSHSLVRRKQKDRDQVDDRIGISYNIGYAVAIALRYIPDVQDDFSKIRNAQEARGIEMSGKASLVPQPPLPPTVYPPDHG